MTSPVERISGPRIVSTPGNFANGNTLSFTATCRGTSMSVDAELVERLARHHLARRSSRAARRSPSRRTAPCGSRAGSPRGCRRRALHRELHVHQADHAELEGEHARLLFDRRRRSPGSSECGGSTLDESPECTPASSMCCITPPMIGPLAVGRRSRRRPRSRPSGTRRSGSSACRLARRLDGQRARTRSSSARVYAIVIARPPST